MQQRSPYACVNITLLPINPIRQRSCVKLWPRRRHWLRNISERVEKLGGRMNIDIENGFQLFITLPREETKEND